MKWNIYKKRDPGLNVTTTATSVKYRTHENQILQSEHLKGGSKLVKPNTSITLLIGGPLYIKATIRNRDIQSKWTRIEGILPRNFARQY